MRRVMQATIRLGMASLLALGLALAAAPPAAAETGEARLGGLIRERLRSGGPFFTPDEQVVIERRCGYAPGEWDGFDFQSIDGQLRCTNGRRLDDAEIRAVMARAEPRIISRVEAVMASADIRAAIDEVAREATYRALRNLESRRRSR